MNRTFRRWLGPAAVGAFLVGCGAQDLYEPPNAPLAKLGELSLPSRSEGVDVLGDYAYVAGGQAGLHIIDLSDPTNPRLVETIDTVKYAESIKVASTGSTVGVVDIAFVVEGTEGVTTYDVTDPTAAFSFQQGTTAVDGDGLFIELRDDPNEPYTIYLAESWKGLRIFEAEPSIPGLLRYEGVFASTGGYARGVTVQDGYAYVADDELGVAVMDVRDRTLGSVVKVAWCDTAGEAEDVAMVGDYLYVADLDNGLVVMEVRQEGTPPVPTPYTVGHVPLPGKCSGLVVRDGRAYIASGDAGLQVVDVRDPTAPVSMGRILTSDCSGVALSPSGLVVVSDDLDGIVVFDSGAPFSDSIPPAAVRDLAAVGINMDTVHLSWHAPGNDRLSGTANEYDIRYALTTIVDDAAWDAATQVEGEPMPSARGTAESFDVSGLASGVEHYFMLRTADATPNWSDRSNEAVATPAAGNVLPSIETRGVTPEGGTAAQTYSFEVVYTDGDGDAPTVAEVVVDGTAHDMTLISGTYSEGAIYRYLATGLEVGGHDHFFRFSDGLHPDVTTLRVARPWVGVSVFQMGSPADEPGRDDDETQHSVVLTHNFWIADAEVTQLEWQTLMGTNPSRFIGNDLPVEHVSWHDAVAYCNARSVDESLTPAYTIDGPNVTWNREADGYRLPTEAEWESACRSGAQTAFAGGGLTDEACGADPVLDALGWYCGNANETTQDVRGKAANSGGYYDMHGNVWEWCWDWYAYELGSDLVADPEGPGGGSQRAIRGGSWFYFARECRSASRAPYWPTSADDTVGFRLARNLP